MFIFDKNIFDKRVYDWRSTNIEDLRNNVGGYSTNIRNGANIYYNMKQYTQIYGYNTLYVLSRVHVYINVYKIDQHNNLVSSRVFTSRKKTNYME